jgi:hypothetical protein
MNIDEAVTVSGDTCGIILPHLVEKIPSGMKITVRRKALKKFVNTMNTTRRRSPISINLRLIYLFIVSFGICFLRFILFSPI